MLQQVTALKGLRIPHSGFRIPDSRFLPSTNPTDWQALKFVTTLTHLRTKFRLKKKRSLKLVPPFFGHHLVITDMKIFLQVKQYVFFFSSC